ncbi:MAG: YceD family protein [bacterium]
MDFVGGGAVVRIDAGALEAGQVVRAPFDERVVSGSSGLILDAPVTGNLDVTRTPLSLRLRGTVATVATMLCGRCLTVIERPLAVTLDEEFSLTADARPEDAEAGWVSGAAPLLDVTEVIRQHLLLAAPMVPLCSSGCRGLCPVCGASRNEADCGHADRPADPRWAPLAELKIEEGNS